MANMGDYDRYIRLKEISVDFIKRRPTSAVELIFEDDTGVKYKSNKFKQGDLVHWYLDMYIKTHTSATLTIRRALFNIRVADISVEFMPNEFRDDRAVGLEDSKHCVTVNFVCVRSQSLADVTRVLSSQAHTALPFRVPRFLKLPQLTALLPPTSERGYDGRVLYVAIHLLNDDILLGIFNCYRLDEKNGWNERLGWCKLSHVCQRWRHLIYESTFHLGMHIRCTNGTPVVDTLDHLPPLPLVVDYRFPITEQDELGIHHALRLHDHIRHIHLHLPASILHKCLVLMDEHFPTLENLTLLFADDKFATLTLPKAFLAPNLRNLALPGIFPSKRLRLLTSTASLVTLVLSNIQASSYFRPRLLVARLGSLPQLKDLSIGFSIPIPRPSAEREMLGEEGTPVTLPNLKALKFRGVGTYLESFVAQMRAPLLKRLGIKLYNQIAFTFPHLSHLINITEAFKLPVARVYFSRNDVSIITAHHISRSSEVPFRFYVKCNQLDWQIDCAAQICSALIPVPSNIKRFKLDFYSSFLPTEWHNGGIDSTTWNELLRLFVGVEELHIDIGLLEELSRALEVDEVGSESGFLPNLQHIVAPANLFSSFINTRRVVGRPVQFSEPRPPPRSRQPPPTTLRRLSSTFSTSSTKAVYGDS